jgi:hypothetical protein
MPENTARYFVNLSRRHKKSIEVTEREWRRISAALLAGANNTRIVVHEEIPGGTRTHFLAHAEILSLEERTGPTDGWEHLDDRETGA